VFDQLWDFLTKHIWEDCCNRPDDVDSCPDALIQKAKLRFKIQTSGRQPSWFGRASYLYGNSVHLINRPDDHYLGLDARSLDMKIACSRSASVRMTRQHCSDTAQIKKEFQRNFGNPIAQLSIRMPYVHRPDGA
jgi:hypothetical protein